GCFDRAPPTTMRSRFFSIVDRPMPLTSASCSGLLKAPCSLRYATMASALERPTLTSAASISAASAVLMSTRSAAVAAPAASSRPRARGTVAKRMRFMSVSEQLPARLAGAGKCSRQPAPAPSPDRPPSPREFRRADVGKSRIHGRGVELAVSATGPAMPSSQLDSARIAQFVDRKWDEDIVPRLVEYIRIPNKSPMFDADWVAHGYMDAAVELMETWARAQDLPGLVVEVIRLEGRTPLIYLEIPATGDETGEDCVLLYGHLDKQPEMTGWDEDLGPWKPVLRGDKLYGRGGADDGYAIFGSLAALLALHEQGAPHARCVILIEACEESGSYDLPAYVDHLAERIGSPSLVVCLDSGCGNYEQLWCTTSLRGLAGGNLTVKVLDEGVHSGDASGIVPSSFRLLRQLLSRIEDEDSGRILLDGLHVEVPADRAEQAKKVAEVL